MAATSPLTAAEDALLLGKPKEALQGAQQALSSGTGSEGAAAATAIQAAQALGNVDEAGKVLKKAYGSGVKALPAEPLVLWAEALADGGKVNEAREAAEEAMGRLTQMESWLRRRAMRLRLVALTAEEGTLAAVDNSRKRLKELKSHSQGAIKEDAEAVEKDLEELEQGLVEGMEPPREEERHQPQQSGKTGEMDWLRSLSAQEGSKPLPFFPARKDQSESHQGKQGPALAIQRDAPHSHQASAGESAQSHGPSLAPPAKKKEQGARSQQAQAQGQQKEENPSEQRGKAKSAQRRDGPAIGRKRGVRALVGGALTAVILWSLLNRKAISRALLRPFLSS